MLWDGNSRLTSMASRREPAAPAEAQGRASHKPLNLSLMPLLSTSSSISKKFKGLKPVLWHIAQKALEDGLSPEQTKQVLKQDPFHQSLALGLGQPEESDTVICSTRLVLFLLQAIASATLDRIHKP